MRLFPGRPHRYAVWMHTHFGSATHLAATFFGVLIAGTFWRLGWMHVMMLNNRHAQGFARAALSQF